MFGNYLNLLKAVGIQTQFWGTGSSTIKAVALKIT